MSDTQNPNFINTKNLAFTWNLAPPPGNAIRFSNASAADLTIIRDAVNKNPAIKLKVVSERVNHLTAGVFYVDNGEISFPSPRDRQLFINQVLKRLPRRSYFSIVSNNQMKLLLPRIAKVNHIAIPISTGYVLSMPDPKTIKQ